MREIYSFGDIPVAVEYRGKYFEKKSKDYITRGLEPLFEIFATDEDLKYEKDHAEQESVYSNSYLEYIAIYRKFCEKAIDYNVALCHGSVVEYEEKAYLFTAPSGTGKSTHTRMWREYFGDKVKMINDDKPLLRFTEQGVYVYGTPWDGKHHLSMNKKSKLQAICFLHQDKENKIVKADPKHELALLMNQIYRPRQPEGMLKTMEYVDFIIKNVPMYTMGCTISHEAAKVAYEGMSVNR